MKLTYQLGPGFVSPLQPLQPDLSGFKLVYTIPTNNATAATLAEDLLRRALVNLNTNANVIRVGNNTALERECPTNFNGRSECFAGLLIQGIDPLNQQLVSQHQCSLVYVTRKVSGSRADGGVAECQIWPRPLKNGVRRG